GRPYLQPGDVGVAGGRLGGAVFEPAAEQLVAAAAGLEALAAAVLHRQRRLLQEDAPLRGGDDDAAALRALDDLGEVGEGVEAEQAELEAAAAVLGAVAGALVAAGLGEHRDHVAGEADRRLGGGVPHAHRHRDRPAAGGDGDSRLAVAGRAEDAM